MTLDEFFGELAKFRGKAELVSRTIRFRDAGCYSWDCPITVVANTIGTCRWSVDKPYRAAASLGLRERDAELIVDAADNNFGVRMVYYTREEFLATRAHMLQVLGLEEENKSDN